MTEKKADNQLPDRADFPAVSLPGIHSGRVGPSIDRIGPYRFVRRLGEGGFGEVHLAEQEQPVRRLVAVKIVKPGMDSRQVIARFEAERQALALLNHEHIAKIYDGGTTEHGRPYFVMEYIEGTPITQYCDEQRLSIQQRLELFIKVCRAVQYAHRKGIIHRDIKPNNILVADQAGEPVPKLIDFGIAKALDQRLTEHTIVTAAGQLFGTPEYMSPEQTIPGNRDIDTLTDVYSLGVLLYELLTGTLPFESDRLHQAAYDEVRRIICEQEPPRPSILLSTIADTDGTIARNRHTETRNLQKQLHNELEWIPLKALRKERQRRYQTATEMADDIRNYLSGNPLIAGPESKAYRVKKYLHKHRYAGAVAGLLVLILIGFSGVSFHLYLSEKRAARDLRQAQQAMGVQTADLVGYGRARMFLAFLDGWHAGTVNRAAAYFAGGKEQQAIRFLLQNPAAPDADAVYLQETPAGDRWFAHFIIAEQMLKNQRPGDATNAYAESIRLLQERPSARRSEADWYLKTIKARLFDLSRSPQTAGSNAGEPVQ